MTKRFQNNFFVEPGTTLSYTRQVDVRCVANVFVFREALYFARPFSVCRVIRFTRFDDVQLKNVKKYNRNTSPLVPPEVIMSRDDYTSRLLRNCPFFKHHIPLPQLNFERQVFAPFLEDGLVLIELSPYYYVQR